MIEQKIKNIEKRLKKISENVKEWDKIFSMPIGTLIEVTTTKGDYQIRRLK